MSQLRAREEVDEELDRTLRKEQGNSKIQKEGGGKTGLLGDSLGIWLRPLGLGQVMDVGSVCVLGISGTGLVRRLVQGPGEASSGQLRLNHGPSAGKPCH